MNKTERGKLANEIIEEQGGLLKASDYFAKKMFDLTLPGSSAFLIPFIVERLVARVRELEHE